MTPQQLEDFTTDWAQLAAQHSLTGDQLRLQQNENYFRRVMLAHVPEQAQREALAAVRRAVFMRAVEEAA